MKVKNTGHLLRAGNPQIEVQTCIFHFSLFIFHLIWAKKKNGAIISDASLYFYFFYFFFGNSVLLTLYFRNLTCNNNLFFPKKLFPK